MHVHVFPLQPNEAPGRPVIVAVNVPRANWIPTPKTGGCVSASAAWIVQVELSAVVMVDGTQSTLVLVARFVTERISGATVLSLTECVVSPPFVPVILSDLGSASVVGLMTCGV